MEGNAQVLQDALGADLAVYLGREWLLQQPQLPHVVMVPTGEVLSAPTRNARSALADATLTLNVICRAVTYDDARSLALFCWGDLQSQGAKPEGSVRYGSEVWGEYQVRVATLTVTLPAQIANTDVTRAPIDAIVARHQFLSPGTPQEAPDDQNDTPYTAHFLEQ